MTIVSLLQLAWQRKSLAVNKADFLANLPMIIAICILGAVASIFMNLGYATGYYSIVTAITSASPAVTVAWGMVFFKEKLTFMQIIAIAIIVMSVIALPLVG